MITRFNTKPTTKLLQVLQNKIRNTKNKLETENMIMVLTNVQLKDE